MKHSEEEKKGGNSNDQSALMPIAQALEQKGAEQGLVPMEQEEEVAGLDAEEPAVMFTVLVGPATAPGQVPDPNVSRVFVVDKAHLLISGLVKAALEEDPKATEIRLREVSPPIFEKIVPYLEHHKGVQGFIPQPPLKSGVDSMEELCKDKRMDPWDAEYVEGLFKADLAAFYSLMLAANYMDIRCLLILTVCKLACFMRKTPYEKIKDGLTPPGFAEKYKTKATPGDAAQPKDDTQPKDDGDAENDIEPKDDGDAEDDGEATAVDE